LLDPDRIPKSLLRSLVATLKDDTGRVQNPKTAVNDNFLNFFCETGRWRDATGAATLERVDQAALANVGKTDDADGNRRFRLDTTTRTLPSVIFEQRQERGSRSRCGGRAGRVSMGGLSGPEVFSL
jgi:hypothetical protein